MLDHPTRIALLKRALERVTKQVNSLRAMQDAEDIGWEGRRALARLEEDQASAEMLLIIAEAWKEPGFDVIESPNTFHSW